MISRVNSFLNTAIPRGLDALIGRDVARLLGHVSPELQAVLRRTFQERPSSLQNVQTDTSVRDAIELSQNKYCSVAATLRKTAEITYQFQILPPTKG